MDEWMNRYFEIESHQPVPPEDTQTPWANLLGFGDVEMIG